MVASFPYSSDAYRVLVGPYHGDGAPKRGTRPGYLILLPPPRGPRGRDGPSSSADRSSVVAVEISQLSDHVLADPLTRHIQGVLFVQVLL